MGLEKGAGTFPFKQLHLAHDNLLENYSNSFQRLLYDVYETNFTIFLTKKWLRLPISLKRRQMSMNHYIWDGLCSLAPYAEQLVHWRKRSFTNGGLTTSAICIFDLGALRHINVTILRWRYVHASWLQMMALSQSSSILCWPAHCIVCNPKSLI